MTPYINFSEVLESLRLWPKKKFSRSGWNSKPYISRQNPDEHSANGRPYLYIMPEDGKRVPWIPSQTDMMMDDWTEIE